MIKKIGLGLLFLGLVGTGRAASTDTITLAVSVPVEHKIVEIHMFKKKADPKEETKKRKKTIEPLPLAGYGICSGAFIDQYGDILTAKHCIEGFDSLEVVTFDQQHFAVTASAVSASHDLGIIHIDRLNTPHFTLAKSLSRGETVYALGSPLGITDTLSKGVVAKLDGDSTLTDLGVLPGNSGCPLINEKGELAGIVTAVFIVGLGTTHLSLSQSLDVIMYFLAGLRG